LGDISMHQSRRDAGAAETLYRKALDLCSELQMNPLAAHCRMGMASVAMARGSKAQAHAAIATAIEQYRGMEMVHWQRRAEAALAELPA
jgi:hypothetical protein